MGGGGFTSQSVPAIAGQSGIGAYKYGSGGSGIGGQIGSLGQAPSYNFGNIPKYNSSGIAGGIGSLGGGIGSSEEPFGGRTKF